MQENHKKIHIIKQITTIFLIQASSTIAYAVFYSGLSIFLTQNKHYSHESSTLITGLFLSLNYLLPLIGGLMTSHIISNKHLYCLSTTFRLAGCILLLNQRFLHLALALFLVGSLANVSLNMLITQLFKREQKTDRKIAFTWNYIGMNVGFMLGYLLTGFSTLRNGYELLFILMACTVLLSLIIGVFFIKEPHATSSSSNKRLSKIILSSIISLLLVCGIKGILDYAQDVHLYITLTALILVTVAMIYTVVSSSKSEKSGAYRFILYSALSIIFWTVYMLTPVAVMQLIQHISQKTVLGMTWAPQWLINIDSILILVISPIFAYLIKRNGDKSFFAKTSNSYMLTFFSAGLAFLTLYLGFAFVIHHGHIPLFIFMVYLFFITLGEILIVPTSSSLVGEFIPDKLKGLMAGAWSINLAIGSLLASTIASKTILPYLDQRTMTQPHELHLKGVFFVISMILLTVTIICLRIDNEKTGADHGIVMQS